MVKRIRRILAIAVGVTILPLTWAALVVGPIGAESNHVPGGPCPGPTDLLPAGVLDYDGMVRELDRLEQTSKGRMTVQTYGQSGLGRDLLAATVGTGPQTFLFWGRLHGNEWVGTGAVLTLLRRLASDDPVATLIREQVTVVGVPMYNPDGSEARTRQEVVHGIDLNRDWVTPESILLPGTFKFLAVESRQFFDFYISLSPEWIVDIHEMGTTVLEGTNDLSPVSIGTAHENLDMTPEQFFASSQMGQVALDAIQETANTNVTRFRLGSVPGTPPRSGLRRMMFDGKGYLGDAGPSHTPVGGIFFENKRTNGRAAGHYEKFVTDGIWAVLASIARDELTSVDPTEFQALPNPDRIPCDPSPV